MKKTCPAGKQIGEDDYNLLGDLQASDKQVISSNE